MAKRKKKKSLLGTSAFTEFLIRKCKELEAEKQKELDAFAKDFDEKVKKLNIKLVYDDGSEVDWNRKPS